MGGSFPWAHGLCPKVAATPAMLRGSLDVLRRPSQSHRHPRSWLAA